MGVKMSFDITQFQWSEQVTNSGLGLSQNYSFDVSSNNGINESQTVISIIKNKDYMILPQNYYQGSKVSEWYMQNKVLSQFDISTGVIRLEIESLDLDVELQSTKRKIITIKNAFSHWPKAAIFKILQVTNKTFYLWKDGETSAKGQNKIRLDKIFSIAKQWIILQKKENHQLPNSLLLTPLGKTASINQLLCEDNIDPRKIIDLMMKLYNSYKHNVKTSDMIGNFGNRRSTMSYDPNLQLLTIQEEL